MQNVVVTTQGDDLVVTLKGVLAKGAVAKAPISGGKLTRLMASTGGIQSVGATDGKTLKLGLNLMVDRDDISEDEKAKIRAERKAPK